MDAVRKHTHYPSDPSGTRRPPKSAFPTNFGRSQQQLLENAPSSKHSGPDLYNQSSTHFRVLSNATIGSLRCSSQCANLVLFLPRMLSTRGVVVFFSCILGRLHFLEGFLIFGPPVASSLPQPCSFLCSERAMRCGDGGRGTAHPTPGILGNAGQAPIENRFDSLRHPATGVRTSQAH